MTCASDTQTNRHADRNEHAHMYWRILADLPTSKKSSSRSMPFLAHNENISLKTSVNDLWKIIFIKRYYLWKLAKSRPHSCEHWTLALYFVNVFVVNPRVIRIMITQPFNKTFISMLLYYLFYPKYVLLRLLKFLFIKRTMNFLSVIISYFIWNGQLNFINFENLFHPSLSVSFIKCVLFLGYSKIITNWNFGVKVLPPNFWYKFLRTLFSFSVQLAFMVVIFIYDWIALLYWSTSKSSTSANFLLLLPVKYLVIFSFIVLLNLSITQDFSSSSEE